MDFNSKQHKKRGGEGEKMNGTIWVAAIETRCGWGALRLYHNKDTMSVSVHSEHENSSSHSAFSLTEAVFRMTGFDKVMICVSCEFD